MFSSELNSIMAFTSRPASTGPRSQGHTYFVVVLGGESGPEDVTPNRLKIEIVTD